MKKNILILIALSLFFTACAPKTIATASPIPAVSTDTATLIPMLPSPFDYDSSIPFNTRVLSETDRDGVTVIDLTFSTHDPSFSVNTAGQTVAYLVKPQGEGPFAGVIFLHWLGVVSGNRGEYLEEAVELARHGVVSLVPQGYFPWMSFPMGDKNDHELMLGQLRELRRMVDFLLAEPEVDPDRLGFVGHDYGALYGGVLAGVDHRIKTYVLVAGTPSFVDFGVLFGFKHDAYLPIVQDLDPVFYVPDAAPASLLFQFGENDAVVPSEKANEYFDAASEPKKMEWYPDIHDMNNAPARQARLEWFIEKLSLPIP